MRRPEQSAYQLRSRVCARAAASSAYQLISSGHLLPGTRQGMPHHRTDQFPHDALGPAVLQAGSAADLAAVANVDHQHGGQEADRRDRERWLLQHQAAHEESRDRQPLKPLIRNRR